MPRGGARPGAGRKPKSGRQHFLAGDPTKRKLGTSRARAIDDSGEAAPTAPKRGALVMPQALLPTEAEQAWWQLLEPEARVAGTLTTQTVAGFVLLCQVAARVGLLWEQIERDGCLVDKSNGSGAHPLWTPYRGLVGRLESLLQRYGLAAMSKSVEPATPATPDRRDSEAEALRRLMSVV